MRPPGVAPRQMARRRVEPDPHVSAAETGQRFTAREHHRVDTALYHRVQAMLVSLQDEACPHLSSTACTFHLRGHADLNGLLFIAYLLASIHPNSDDFDI